MAYRPHHDIDPSDVSRREYLAMADPDRHIAHAPDPRDRMTDFQFQKRIEDIERKCHDDDYRPEVGTLTHPKDDSVRRVAVVSYCRKPGTHVVVATASAQKAVSVEEWARTWWERFDRSGVDRSYVEDMREGVYDDVARIAGISPLQYAASLYRDAQAQS